MGKKKEATDEVKETKERAAVGRERRLALALAGLLDAYDPNNEHTVDECAAAVGVAQTLLNDLGYSNLESTAKTLARINKHINDAVAAGDGERLAELGKELQKAKAGKFCKPSAKSAGEQS